MDELVATLRQEFRTKFLDRAANSVYDRRDVDRLMNVDKYAQGFIRAKNGNVPAATEMCHKALKWRKEVGLHDLTDASFPEDLLKKGAMYFRNNDKEDNPIFYFRISFHKKDPKTLPIIQKYMIYLLDQEDRRHEGRQVIILFDMTDAGLSNLDLELIKFLITCFEEYFPDHLAYLLVYDMPWILNAAWKIIKAWLSEDARKKVLFVRGSEILDLVDRDNLFVHMGGKDDYVFEYEPLQPVVNHNHNHRNNNLEVHVNGRVDSLSNTATTTTIATTVIRPGLGPSTSTFTAVDEPPITVIKQHSPTDNTAPKHVTFSEDDPTVFTSLIENSDEDASTPSPSKANNYQFRIPANTKFHAQAKRDDSTFIDSLITISPGNELTFSLQNGQKDASGMILLTNPRTQLRTAYKVKTTSPEKYKVRPSQGVIKPGQGAEITVYLAQGHEETVVKDKFLVMAMELEDGFISSGELAEVWKNTPKNKITEHRLRCSYIIPPPSPKEDVVVAKLNDDKIADLEKEINYLGKKIDTLLSSNNNLERRLQRLGRYQVLMIIFLVVFSMVIVMTTYQRLQSIQHFTNNRSQSFSSCFLK